MALNVLAASDIFAQDLEDPDLPEGARGGQRTGARQQARRPQPARRPTNAADGSTNTGGAAPSGGASRVINDGQHRLLRAKLNEAGMDADALCKRFDVESITQLPMDRMNDALAFIADPERDAIRAAAGEGDGGQPPQQ
jgi:hypothetical protein